MQMQNVAYPGSCFSPSLWGYRTFICWIRYTTKIIFYAIHDTFLIDDGTLRVYDLSSFRVIKAIRGLGAEVSSIVCIKRTGSVLRDAWVAHGTKVASPPNSLLY